MTLKNKTNRMKATVCRAWVLLLLGAIAGSVVRAQAPDPDSSVPLLTLDEAVRIATGNNRDVRISGLSVTKAKEEVAQAKTNYLPSLSANVLGGIPLQPLNFSVPAGSFGTYPSTGPIPAKESNIHSPQRLSAFINGSVSQPLTQLYKYKLSVQEARVSADIAQEDVRAQEQEITRQVKDAYYQVAQLQAQIEGAKANVKSLRELSELTQRRLVAQTVLASDPLSVKAKLKQQRYELLTLEDSFEVQKQSLNHLLGRDLRTQFTVEMQPAEDLTEADLEVARKQALDQRPEIREARLQTKNAQLEVRHERAKYIPDLSLAVQYMSFQNFSLLPQNAGMVGFLFQWQPFDWGYKKHRIRELKATSQQKLVTEQDTEQKVLLEVEDKFRKLEEARMLLEAQSDTREAEQVRLREITNRYGQQAALLSDLLAQQATLSQAEAQYQQAVAGFWTARAEYDKAIGAN
jgi:outer membrane protein TolC